MVPARKQSCLTGHQAAGARSETAWIVWKEGAQHLDPMVVSTMVNIIVRIYMFFFGLN